MDQSTMKTFVAIVRPRVFMPYVGGFQVYAEKCEDVVEKGYEGFILS